MKAQMEMIGLAVIVVLVVVAFLLFLVFLRPSDSLASDFRDAQLPSAVLDVLGETTTGCQKQSVSILLSDIGARVNSAKCEESIQGEGFGNPSQIQCGEDHYSYRELFYDSNAVVPTILRNTLQESFLNYEFEIVTRTSSGECVVYEEGFNSFDLADTTPCVNAPKIDAKTVTLPTTTGNVVDVTLRVC